MTFEETVTFDAENAPSSAAATVVIVDADPKIRTRIALQLDDGTPASTYASLGAVLENHDLTVNTVLVFGPSMSSAEDLRDVADLIRSARVEAVMVVEELSTTLLQQAIRWGVSDVLALDTISEQLNDAVKRAMDNMPEEIRAPVQMVPAAAEDAGPKGRVISVFSTKGGAGKSVLAANLACVLARKSERPVVIVDADLQFGDIAVMLKLTPQHTIVDAVAAIDRLDEQLIRNLLIRHDQSGVLVLAAPTEPAFADQVDSPTMNKIVELLRSFCDYVVIDTPAHFNEVVLGLLENSDDVVLLAGMDIPNIKNVKIGLQVLRLLDMPASRMKLVLNRANSKVKLDISEVERTLQMKADGLIPSDMIVPQSVNKGVPAVLDSPRSAVTKSIEALADLLVQGAQQQIQRRQ